ncbi:hypothetical protein EON67_04275 [archaeon]|nr:MAG: hypothetical protein EON67_04275 [archaeon]
MHGPIAAAPAVAIAVAAACHARVRMHRALPQRTRADACAWRRKCFKRASRADVLTEVKPAPALSAVTLHTYVHVDNEQARRVGRASIVA